jgi:hypothetical protein
MLRRRERMIINNSIRFDSAIVLTPELLKEVDEFVRIKMSFKNSSDLKYSVKVINGSIVTFSSLEELLNYDNYLDQRIRNITIKSIEERLKISIRVYYASFTSFDHTVEVDYAFSEQEEEILFRSGIERIFNKAKPFCAWVYKFHIVQLMFMAAILSIISIVTFDKFIDIEISNADRKPYIASALIMFISLCVVSGFRRVWQSLFPPIVFLWGEETKINQRKITLRSILLTGIFLPLVFIIVEKIW